MKAILRNLVVLFSLWNVNYTEAQDTIFLKNGLFELGKVLQIKEKQVILQTDTLLKSPKKVISLGEIDRIKYANGQEPTQVNLKFATLNSAPNIFTNQTSNYLKNSIFFNFIESLNFRIGFTYEYFIDKKKRFSLRIPFSASYRPQMANLSRSYSSNNNYNFDITYKSEPFISNSNNNFLAFPGDFTGAGFYNNLGHSFYSGLGFRHYIRGLKSRNFYYGAIADLGFFKFQIYEYPNYFHKKYAFGEMYRIQGEIGMRYNPSPNISLLVGVALGYIRLQYQKQGVLTGLFLKNVSFNPSFGVTTNFNFKKKNVD